MTNIFDFVEPIDASQFNDTDYEIASLFVVDDDLEEHTFKDVFIVGNREFYEKNKIETEFLHNAEIVLVDHPKNDFTLMGMQYSPCNLNKNEKWYFYRLNEKIDFDLGVKLGLGVAKILAGEYRDEYVLYNAWRGEDEEYTIEDMLLLKMYIQLTHPKDFDDKKLEAFIGEDNEVIEEVLNFGGIEEKHKIGNKLREIYRSKKGGLNVLEYKKKTNE